MKKFLFTLIILLSGSGIARAQWDSICWLPEYPFIKTPLIAYCYSNEFGGTPSNPIGYGRIAKSVDGCISWQKVLEWGGQGNGNTCYFSLVDFVTDSIGYLYACGPSYATGLYQTTDGSISWNKLLRSFFVENISFPRADYGYFLGADNFAAHNLCNYDHGQITKLDSVSSLLPGFSSMKFINDSTGFFIYGTNKSMLYRTDNRCQTLVKVFDSVGSVKKVVFANQYRYFILKKPDSLFTSTDLGISWSFVNIIPLASISDMFFLTSDSGWICGPGGKIFATVNGGITWTEMASSTNYDIVEIHFFTSSNGYFIAKKDYFYSYSYLLYRTHGFNDVTETEKAEKPLRLLQNPARTNLNLVRVRNLIPINNLELISSSGKSLYFSKYFISKVDISAFSPGLYFLRYNYQKQTFTEKFLIVRD